MAALAAASPPRVASLNLCTDELVLLVAAPEQVVSVTHLVRNRHESPLWRIAQRFPANDGSIASIAGWRPDIIVTMGSAGRDRQRLANRIGARLIALDYPQTPDDVAAATMRIARAIGRERQAERIARALRQLQSRAPSRPVEGVFLSGGGLTHPAGSLGANWLALAGIETPQEIGPRISAERMLIDPPALVVRSDYRRGQASRGNHWLGYRFLARARSTRTLWTDGRRWTCAGPLMIAEMARLRRELRQ